MNEIKTLEYIDGKLYTVNADQNNGGKALILEIDSSSDDCDKSAAALIFDPCATIKEMTLEKLWTDHINNNWVGKAEPKPGEDPLWDYLSEDQKNLFRSGGHITSQQIKSLIGNGSNEAFMSTYGHQHELDTTPPVDDEKVVQQHFERKDRVNVMFKKTREIFGQIFSGVENRYFSSILNHLRAECCPNWREDFTPWNNQCVVLLAVISDLVTYLPHRVFKGKILKGDEPEREEQAKFQLHSLKMKLYRFQKKYRKHQRNVSVSLLTPGTVVERKVLGVDVDVRQLTVDYVINNWCGTVIIICKEVKRWFPDYDQAPFPIGVPESFNSTHVIRVVKHQSGPLKIERQDKDDAKFLEHLYGDHKELSKSRYITYHLNNVVARVVQDLYPREKQDTSSSVSVEHLTQAVMASMGSSIRVIDREYICQFMVNKKKLKKAVRRLYNKSLLSMKKQEELKDAYDMSWEDDHSFDDDGCGGVCVDVPENSETNWSKVFNECVEENIVKKADEATEGNFSKAFPDRF